MIICWTERSGLYIQTFGQKIALPIHQLCFSNNPIFPMKINTRNMSPVRMLFGIFVFLIRFSSASDDELLSLLPNDNDLFQSAPLLDFADPALFSNVEEMNSGENSNVFSMLPNDSYSSDLFHSDVDSNSVNDSTFLADCGSIDNDLLRKIRKARIRRDAPICHNPNSEPVPNLSLPTLDQVFPSESDKDSLLTTIWKNLGSTQNIPLHVRLGLTNADFLLQCGLENWRLCFSGNPDDIKLERDEQSYTVKHAENSKCFRAFSAQRMHGVDFAL